MTAQGNVVERLSAALEGRYRIEGELGEGGMATVFLAEDLKHDRQVAIKVLKPELAAVIGGERFVAEIKTTAALQHPHILPLFDSGEADGFLYYVMPYVEGESLRDRLDREGQLGVGDALAITRDVADALDYAHRQGVIHRDIKPENILLHDGRPVVADFGIAVAISAAGGGRMTETGLSLGTPHYMSPEQATAERDLTVRSDVYSLACVLYEMLAGDPPHTGPTAQAILVRILTERPRPVSDTRTAAPPHVAAVLMKALEKLPADRFESAAQFREALDRTDFVYQPTRRALATPAGGAAVDGPTASAAGPRRSWILALATIAVLAVAAAWGWLRSPEQAPAQPPVRVPLPTDSLSPGFADLAISLDGSRIAVASSVGGIYLRSSADPEFRLVRGSEGGRQPTFSPDGEWIAFRREGALLKVAVDGGSPLTLVDDPEIEVFMPHWGREGEIVFANTSGLYRVADTGGEPEPVGVGGVFPHLVEGGGILATGWPGRTIDFIDPATDSSRVLVEEGMRPVYVPRLGHVLYGHPNGGLFAVPFDPEAGEVTGPIRPVLDEVAVAFGAAFAVADNGTLFYRKGTGGGALGAELLMMLGVDGTVDTLPLAPRDFDRVRFSPDGRRLSFDSDGDIYTYDLELGTTTQLTFADGDDHNALWSPDGTHLAYAYRGPDASHDALMVKAVTGDSPARMIYDGPGDEHPVAWPAPDLLAFERNEGTNQDLLILDPTADPAEPVPYLEAEWNEFALDVSPDGRFAAYTSAETNRWQVYVRRFPEPEGQWRISEDVGAYPHWSADGGTIYYPVAGGSTDALMAARIRTEPSVVVESRELIATGRYDFDDGDFDPVTGRFVLPQDRGAGGDESGEGLWLVVNWFTELEERLGGGRDR